MSSSSAPKSSNSGPNRRSFLARSAALAAIPAVASLAGGTLAEPASADTLPDYASIPPSALGPAVNAQGYFVGRVEKNLYWVTDSAYQAAFLTTRDGVVLFDAPPSIGHNLQRAIDQIAAENGVPKTVTHLVYSHHHADHIGGSSLFGKHVVRIGQVQAKQLLASENDPARPVPDVTFETKHTLNVGGERVNLAWHGTNHTPDNSYIHFPDHDTLMLVDIFLPRWVPFDSFNLNEDVPGSIAAPDTAMAYPWKHFIGGHMGRLGTRADMVLYQQYVNDIIDGVKKALATVQPDPVLRQVREQRVGCVPAVPGRGGRLRLRASDQKVPRGPSRCRRLYGEHDVRHPRVDPPRPRFRLAGPPVTGATSGPGRGPLPAGPTGGAMTGNGRDFAGPSRSARDTRAGPGTARYSSPATGSSGREPKSSE